MMICHVEEDTEVLMSNERKNVLLIPCMQYLLMGIAKRPNMSALFTARIGLFFIQGLRSYSCTVKGSNRRPYASQPSQQPVWLFSFTYAILAGLRFTCRG
jgi:hypothetical protein